MANVSAHIALTHDEVCEALIQYVQRVHGFTPEEDGRIYVYTQNNNEGECKYSASIPLFVPTQKIG